MNISFKAVTKKTNISNIQPSETKQTDVIKKHNSLVRSPEVDTVSFSKTAEVKKKDAAQNELIQKKLNYVKENKILTDEDLYYLQPQKGKNGAPEFTKMQAEIIDSATKKVKLFKSLATELGVVAADYGDEIHEHMKNVFGGNDGFGQYIIMRKKDPKSIYDKLAKEFKNHYIKNGVHDIFAQKMFQKNYNRLDDSEKEMVKLYIKEGEVPLDKKDYQAINDAFKPDTKNYLSKKYFKKGFDDLSRAEKTEMRAILAKKKHSSSKIEKEEAASWIRDLIGLRLVLPEGNRVNMGKVERYLDKALKKNQLHLTRISNYRSNSVLPYLNQDTARRWKDTIPGVELVTSSVKKMNGYTTTQMNFEYDVPGREEPVLIEFQIRSKEMNYINDVEHYIYDVLENKDITKGIPELKQFFEASGFEKAVKEVFGKQNIDPNSPEAKLPTKEQRYMDYEHAMFAYIRDSETPTYKFGKMFKPILADFGLGEYESVLSFDALNGMNEKAQIIKAKYGNKSTTKK